MRILLAASLSVALALPAAAQSQKDCQALAMMFAGLPMTMSGMKKSAEGLSAAGAKLRPTIKDESKAEFDAWIASADGVSTAIENFIAKSRAMRNVFEGCS